MNTSIVIAQMKMFATMITAGYLFRKTNIINDDQVAGFSAILTKFIIPCMLISMMPNGGNIESIKSCGSALIVTIVYIGCMLLISSGLSLILGFKDKTRKHMNVLVTACGNAGFIGSPLCAVMYPTEGIVNAFYVVFEAMVCWIIGPIVADTEMRFKAENLKKLINPIMCAIALGFLLTLLDIHPAGTIPWDTITAIGGTTKYFATLYIGFNIGQIGFRRLFADPRIMVSSVFKLVAFPLALFAVLHYCGIMSGDRLGVFLIMGATPTGMAIPMVAEVAHGDKDYAIAGTMINTLLCLFTLPLVTYIASMM